jgi:hypothetical protein
MYKRVVFIWNSTQIFILVIKHILKYKWVWVCISYSILIQKKKLVVYVYIEQRERSKSILFFFSRMVFLMLENFFFFLFNHKSRNRMRKKKKKNREILVFFCSVVSVPSMPQSKKKDYFINTITSFCFFFTYSPRSYIFLSLEF